MTAPRDVDHGPAPTGHRPCSRCLRYAHEWTDADAVGTRHAITLPRGERVRKGQSWTCTLCRNDES